MLRPLRDDAAAGCAMRVSRSVQRRPARGGDEPREGDDMKSASIRLGACGIALGLASFAATAGAPRIGKHEIGGQVLGDHGPEAGVWVIAETRDLPTRY